MPLMAFFTASGAVCLLSKEAESDRSEINKQVTEDGLRAMRDNRQEKSRWNHQ